MTTVVDVYRFLQKKAPFELQKDYDNSGFLVGRGDAEVTKILVALDITDTVIREAIMQGAQLIVAHHPVIFDGIKSVTDQTVTGRDLLTLAENRIAAICAHTNLDAVEDGVNDALALRLGLSGGSGSYPSSRCTTSPWRSNPFWVPTESGLWTAAGRSTGWPSVAAPAPV